MELSFKIAWKFQELRIFLLKSRRQFSIEISQNQSFHPLNLIQLIHPLFQKWLLAWRHRAAPPQLHFLPSQTELLTISYYFSLTKFSYLFLAHDKLLFLFPHFTQH